MISKTIVNLCKLLVDIIKDDSQSQVKDLSVEILLILKIILQEEGDNSNLEKYENLISSLPNFRVNMIISGRTKSLCENQNVEKEYKANLNKIKSNLQFSSRNKSQKKLGRTDTIQSASKEKNLKNGLKKNLKKYNKYKAIDTSVSKFDKIDNIDRFDESNDSYNSIDKNKISYKTLNKNKSKNLLVIKKGNKTTNKTEDSKSYENNDSDYEENVNNKKNIKDEANTKSPNIKLISKKNIIENPENTQKYLNKKKLDYEDKNNSLEKYKKIKQKEIDEKVKKELRGKI